MLLAVLTALTLGGGEPATSHPLAERGIDMARTGPDSPLSNGLGFWRLTTTSPASVCLLSLNRVVTGKGYGLVRERCDATAVSQAVAWRPVATGLELIKADGSVVLRLFNQTEDVLADATGRSRLTREPLR